MHVLKGKDDNLYRETGYRRYWIITNIDDFYMHVKNNEGALEGKVPRTFDFTTMYTQLPHEKIFNNIEQAVDEAISYLRIRSSSHPLITKKHLIIKYLRFVVSNTYFGNNSNDIRQQTIGIPMGTNSAPEIANLTLYVDEANYIDNLRSNSERKKYSLTKRYIDDSVFFDTTPPPEEIYGLRYSEQTQQDGSINFLGAKIILKEGKIEMSVFDKTKEWNFPVIRYCHGESNAPWNQSISIYLGQMIRYYNICNNLRSFKIATSSLTLRLLERKHSVFNLKKAWKKFLIKYFNNRLDRYGTINKWFRKMLTWCTYQMHRPQWQLRNRAVIQTTTSPQTFRNSSNNSSAANISIVENIIASLQNNQSTNLVKDPTPMTQKRSSSQHHRLLIYPNSCLSNKTLNSPSSSNIQPSTYLSRELVRSPSDFNLTLWNKTSEENRKSFLDFIQNESTMMQQINLMNSYNMDSDETQDENYLENQSDTNIQDSQDENYLVNQSDTNIQDSQHISANNNLGMHMEKHAADLSPNTDIQDSQHISADNNLGMNMENHAADLSPNKVTLSMLLNDLNIISDEIFQPIHKYLIKLKERTNKRNRFISKIGVPINCPICLQDFQKLLIHQRYASAPYGCYNMARVREYICLKKGILFQRSTTSAVTLYPDFNSLESTILDLN